MTEFEEEPRRGKILALEKWWPSEVFLAAMGATRLYKKEHAFPPAHGGALAGYLGIDWVNDNAKNHTE